MSKIAIVLGCAALAWAIATTAIWGAWNHAVPRVFGAPEIGWTEAWALTILVYFPFACSKFDMRSKGTDR